MDSKLKAYGCGHTKPFDAQGGEYHAGRCPACEAVESAMTGYAGHYESQIKKQCGLRSIPGLLKEGFVPGETREQSFLYRRPYASEYEKLRFTVSVTYLSEREEREAAVPHYTTGKRASFGYPAGSCAGVTPEKIFIFREFLLVVNGIAKTVTFEKRRVSDGCPPTHREILDRVRIGEGAPFTKKETLVLLAVPVVPTGKRVPIQKNPVSVPELVQLVSATPSALAALATRFAKK